MCRVRNEIVVEHGAHFTDMRSQQQSKWGVSALTYNCIYQTCGVVSNASDLGMAFTLVEVKLHAQDVQGKISQQRLVRTHVQMSKLPGKPSCVSEGLPALAGGKGDHQSKNIAEHIIRRAHTDNRNRCCFQLREKPQTDRRLLGCAWTSPPKPKRSTEVPSPESVVCQTEVSTIKKRAAPSRAASTFLVACPQPRIYSLGHPRDRRLILT